jgi:C1A family cysteine protease
VPPTNEQTGHGYGWLPSPPDQRDLLFAPDLKVMKKLGVTPKVDLSTSTAMPKIWDQGQLGSCSAHAAGGSFAFAHKKSGHRAMMPSRLHIYWHERYLEGSTGYDAGAYLRDGFKVMAQIGVAHEIDWPYDISKFTEQPPPKAETDAVKHRTITYSAVSQALTTLKGCLLNGFPFAFGFTVYESFESQEVATTGIVPMPSPGESVLGGHAVMGVGYDDATQRFKVRNQWGKEWGLPEAPGFWTCSVAT